MTTPALLVTRSTHHRFEDWAAYKASMIEQHHDINVDHEWYQLTCEHFEEQMAEFGLLQIKTGFSGFWSQGDGAHFTVESGEVDLEKWLRKRKRLTHYRKALRASEEGHLHLSIVRSSHFYSHENTVSACVEDYSEVPEALLSELESEFIAWARGEMRRLYRMLEAEYEHRTSEQEIWSALVANDMLDDDAVEYAKAHGHSIEDTIH